MAIGKILPKAVEPPDTSNFNANTVWSSISMSHITSAPPIISEVVVNSATIISEPVVKSKAVITEVPDTSNFPLYAYA